MKMDNLTDQIIKASKYTHERRLNPGKAGNISCRFQDIVAITPTLSVLHELKAEDIAFVTMDGERVNNNKPSSELDMHLKIYRKNKDVSAVVHLHSPYATGFARSNHDLERLEGYGKIKNKYVKSVPYYNPGSVELADSVSHALRDEDVIILKNHGLVATGSSCMDAALLAEFIEECAKTQFVSYILNK